jgi:DNA-binding NarL/FixJ family response regulator
LGATYFSPEVREVIFSAPRLVGGEHLTGRQLDVLRAIVRSPEASRDEIAESLHISKSTLQKHITALFAALEVPNMEACIIKAMRMRLIDPTEVLGPEAGG